MKRFKVGYTTGVFDLFHVGHLNILKRAKSQCERLVVGVSTDELVATYKKNKPVIPFQERLAVVEAIRYVDEVVAQETMDKMDAWERIHYDALFHGDDWRNTPMYKEIESKLRAAGAELVYFPYTQGTSSTLLADLLNKLKMSLG